MKMNYKKIYNDISDILFEPDNNDNTHNSEYDICSRYDRYIDTITELKILLKQIFRGEYKYYDFSNMLFIAYKSYCSDYLILSKRYNSVQRYFSAILNNIYESREEKNGIDNSIYFIFCIGIYSIRHTLLFIYCTIFDSTFNQKII
jgi:dolichol kinase